MILISIGLITYQDDNVHSHKWYDYDGDEPDYDVIFDEYGRMRHSRDIDDNGWYESECHASDGVDEYYVDTENPVDQFGYPVWATSIYEIHGLGRLVDQFGTLQLYDYSDRENMSQ